MIFHCTCFNWVITGSVEEYIAWFTSSSFFLFLQRGAGLSPLLGALLFLRFFLSSGSNGPGKSGWFESENVYWEGKMTPSDKSSKIPMLYNENDAFWNAHPSAVHGALSQKSFAVHESLLLWPLVRQCRRRSPLILQEVFEEFIPSFSFRAVGWTLARRMKKHSFPLSLYLDHA